MITKHLYIDDEDIKYKISNTVTKVIIFIYHEKVKILNVYKFNPSEEWRIENQHPEDPFIITLHGLCYNETVDKFNHQKSVSGDIDNCTIVSYRKYDENTEYQEEDYDIEIDEIPIITHIDQEHDEEVFGDKIMVIFKHPIFNSSYQEETTFFIQIIEEKFFKISKPSNQQIKCCIPLPGRKELMVELYQVRKVNDHHYFVLKKIKSKNFITHNTQNDVKKLMKKAEEYISEKRSFSNNADDHIVRRLYRGKPSKHPTIEEYRKTGIMRKYIKNNSGDPFSSINDQIKGLSFSAPNLFTGNVDKKSFHGNYRILFEPKLLVAEMNLYFADFMCMNGHKCHWITLVLTKPGSEEDYYCKPRLVKLDIYDNPILFCNRDEGNYYVHKCGNLKIAIFYTEDIDVEEMRKNGHIEETEVEVMGSGEENPNGIPKTRDCEICNL